jgi:hypothetical protein
VSKSVRLFFCSILRRVVLLSDVFTITLPVPHRIFIVPDGLHGFFQYPYNNTNAAGLQPLPPGWEIFPL